MNQEEAAKQHWENVFLNKDTSKVSWYQATPQLSMELIDKYINTRSLALIDIGGGDSRLPDGLLKSGYENITVLDISEKALSVSKKRLGAAGNAVNWIVKNVLAFDAKPTYNLWHDRAVFHFLSTEDQQSEYKKRLLSGLADKGLVIIGAFSKNEGPDKCSGLEIQQHDRETITKIFLPEFSILEDFEAEHETPSGSKQKFYWVVLIKK